MPTHLAVSVPTLFYHAGLISPQHAKDVRNKPFDTVDVDLRYCEFIAPAAVVWCAVYPLLAAARGSKTRLLVPDNVGVCVYLKSTGLFRLLQERGIEVDDRGIREQDDPQVVMPITQVFTDADVIRAVQLAEETLRASGRGAGNITSDVSDILTELLQNVVQHADSPIGGLGFVQFRQTQKGRRFVCVVADGGVGIKAALERNPIWRPQAPYDWTAIELALRERVSGTVEPTKGIGLFWIAEQMRKAGRQMIIHSGQGTMSVISGIDDQAQRTTLFPGTLVSSEIPT